MSVYILFRQYAVSYLIYYNITKEKRIAFMCTKK